MYGELQALSDSPSAFVGIQKRAPSLGSLRCLQAAADTSSGPSSTISSNLRGNYRLLKSEGWVVFRTD